MFTEPVSPQTNQSETSTQKLRANTLSSSQNEIDLRTGDDEVMTGSSTQLAPPPVSSRPRPVPPKSLGPGIRGPHHHHTPRTSSSPHPKDVKLKNKRILHILMHVTHARILFTMYLYWVVNIGFCISLHYSALVNVNYWLNTFLELKKVNNRTQMNR